MLGENLFAIGGSETLQETTVVQKRVHIYCHYTNSWVYVSDLPESLTQIATATLPHTKILVIGASSADKTNKMYKGLVTLQQYHAKAT